ncbi:hypothetical protein JQ607_01265 [Bradyrhizobium liaoningense]|uniref:hypothetical protein n=1 Tax=Bradyrhizobium liaoningense TaxID=43992 RepID=UPI001BAC8D28|nr:hypothetical protein [Bradyrhizobium liaoningense]MBR0838819.1 hypothetical protein [Bradyrhizobium liaoningense]
MADAFDQFWGWREKPHGSRLAIPSELYSAVMSLPEVERASREAVNAAVEHWAELRGHGQTVWIYLNDFDNGSQRKVGDPEWIKLFGSEAAADRWLQEHDPEGVAWVYETEGVQRHASLWIYLADERSRAIGPPAWAKLFASRQVAEKWLKQHAPNGNVWKYPIDD